MQVGRLLRACVELGEANPVSSVHDQGAGGNANVLKELVAPAGGADIDMRVGQAGRQRDRPSATSGTQAGKRVAGMVADSGGYARAGVVRRCRAAVRRVAVG